MFRFSLQVALDVRERQEKVKMKELAEALSVRQGIANEIDTIHENTRNADRNLDNMKRSQSFDLEQMRFLSRFKSRMKVVLAHCHERLEKAEVVVAERQQALIQASKARKTIEILKEKELKRFKEKITRIERKSMDEIAGNLFIRSKNLGHA
ncbi:MAG: flagellar export protein FliJ [Proteobacteria bacterium]|nr:flagellar export protein FliJ [Pseudomonadota bacterium]